MSVAEVPKAAVWKRYGSLLVAARRRCSARLSPRCWISYEPELAPSSLLETLLIERIAATLWRTRRVLAFEAGTALERDTTPEPDVERLLRSLGSGRPSDPEGFERGRALARALAPANAVELAMRYEAHLTRELSRPLSLPRR